MSKRGIRKNKKAPTQSLKQTRQSDCFSSFSSTFFLGIVADMATGKKQKNVQRISRPCTGGGLSEAGSLSFFGSLAGCPPGWRDLSRAMRSLIGDKQDRRVVLRKQWIGSRLQLNVIFRGIGTRARAKKISHSGVAYAGASSGGGCVCQEDGYTWADPRGT